MNFKIIILIRIRGSHPQGASNFILIVCLSAADLANESAAKKMFF
jgi:hypothetical protein